MAVRLPTSSREFLYLRGLKAFSADSPDAADPTTLDVEVALLGTVTLPIETDWKPAAWLNEEVVRVLIGEGTDFAMEPGTYSIWLRVKGAVERPERVVGTVTFATSG